MQTTYHKHLQETVVSFAHIRRRETPGLWQLDIFMERDNGLQRRKILLLRYENVSAYEMIHVVGHSKMHWTMIIYAGRQGTLWWYLVLVRPVSTNVIDIERSHIALLMLSPSRWGIGAKPTPIKSTNLFYLLQLSPSLPLPHPILFGIGNPLIISSRDHPLTVLHSLMSRTWLCTCN